MLLVVSGGIAVGGYAVIRDSPLFGVDRITVSGAGRDIGAVVDAEARTVVGDHSLLAVDPSAMATALATLPVVRRVSVDRAFPHELRIRVVPEVPAAVVDSPDGRIVLAASGRVIGDLVGFERLPLLEASAVSIPAAGGTIREGVVDQLALAAALVDQRGLRVTSIGDGDGGLVARLRDDAVVRFGGADDLDRKLQIATAILRARSNDPTRPADEKLRYLDVSVPDHPVARTTTPDAATASGEVLRPPGAAADDGGPVDVRTTIESLFLPITVK